MSFYDPSVAAFCHAIGWILLMPLLWTLARKRDRDPDLSKLPPVHVVLAGLPALVLYMFTILVFLTAK